MSCPGTQRSALARARTWTAPSGVQRTNHQATAPPTLFVYIQCFSIISLAVSFLILISYFKAKYEESKTREIIKKLKGKYYVNNNCTSQFCNTMLSGDFLMQLFFIYTVKYQVFEGLNFCKTPDNSLEPKAFFLSLIKHYIFTSISQTPQFLKPIFISLWKLRKNRALHC